MSQMMVKNICSKCGDVIIRHQKYIVYCQDCRREMDRFRLDREELNSEEKMSDEEEKLEEETEETKE